MRIRVIIIELMILCISVLNASDSASASASADTSSVRRARDPSASGGLSKLSNYKSAQKLQQENPDAKVIGETKVSTEGKDMKIKLWANEHDLSIFCPHVPDCPPTSEECSDIFMYIDFAKDGNGEEIKYQTVDISGVSHHSQEQEVVAQDEMFEITDLEQRIEQLKEFNSVIRPYESATSGDASRTEIESLTSDIAKLEESLRVEGSKTAQDDIDEQIQKFRDRIRTLEQELQRRLKAVLTRATPVD
eukprot:189149_1